MKVRIPHYAVATLAGAALILGAYSGAAHADILFASTATNNSVADFGTLNTATGVYTPLGNNGVTLSGLGTLNGLLYGAAYNTSSGTLFTVNTANGSLTAVGTSNVAYLDFAAAAGGLWAVGTDDNLYSINASTGAATLVGPTNLAASTANFNSLASGLGFLFYDLMDGLFTLNPNTGASSFVGCGGALVFQVCSGPQMSAMAASSGIVYGVDSVVEHLHTINTSTGQATFTVTVTGNGNFISGLSVAPASVSAVPEPGSLSLLGVAAAFLLATRRRMR